MPIGALVVAILNQIAANDQQIGLGRHRVQLVDHQVQAPDVELVRVVAVEANVQIGNLRDQHGEPADDEDLITTSPWTAHRSTRAFNPSYSGTIPNTSLRIRPGAVMIALPS